MHFSTRLFLLTALLSAVLASPAEAQYMYLDANGDGIWSSADQLNPDTTTVDVWLNTNTNRDGSVSTCNDRTLLPVSSAALLSNTTLGSNEVTSDDPTRFASVLVGMTVSGSGIITAGTTVTAKASNSRMTLSAQALASGSTNLTYSLQINASTQTVLVSAWTGPWVIATCATTSGSTTVTSSVSAFGSGSAGPVVIGEAISGPGIPAGATVTAKASATSLTISAAATETGTGVSLSFGNDLTMTSSAAFGTTIVAGMEVRGGTGLAAGTKVASKTSTSLLTIDTPATVASVGTRTFAGFNLTSVTAGAMAPITIGMTITGGIGIPTGTVVAAIVSTSVVTMSNSATASSTSIRTIGAVTVESDTQTGSTHVGAGLFIAGAVKVGSPVSGIGIPGSHSIASGTIVTGWINKSLITISNPADSTGTNSLTYYRPLDVGGYDIIFHATGGTVTYSPWVPAPGFSALGTEYQSDTDATVHRVQGGGNLFGLVKLGSMTVTVTGGAPQIGMASTTSIDPAASGTLFATNCDGGDLRFSYVLGPDWLDTDGVAASAERSNALPSLIVPDTVRIVAGSAVSIQAVADDADRGEVLSMAAQSLPTWGLELTRSSGSSPLSAALTGTVGYGDAGAYEIIWSVSDGANPSVTAKTVLVVSPTSPSPMSAAPIARYVLRDSFPGTWTLPHRRAWSPNGVLLALVGPDGLYVYDVRSKGTPPRKVSDIRTIYIDWSPDGLWILGRGDAKGTRGAELPSLVAIPTSGGAPVTVVPSADFLQFLWAPNGRIYFWDARTGIRRSVAPPSSWTSANPFSFPSRPVLVSLHRQLDRQSLLLSFSVVDGEEEKQFLAIGPSGWAIAREPFPDGQRYLATILREPQPPATEVVDATGKTVARLGVDSGMDRFTGTTVSSDGRFVLGYRETDQGDRVVDSQLILADAAGTWKVPVESAPRAVIPQLSPRGYRVASTDPVTGTIHVGEVEIAPR